jgi:lipopolysaccharide export system protein LptA
LTIVDWLRTTMQARLEARHRSETAATRTTPQVNRPAVTMDDDGVPTFHLNAKSPKPVAGTVRYVAKFEKDVDGRQFRGDTVISQLLADTLIIEREMRDEEQRQAAMTPVHEPTDEHANQPASTTSHERMELTWSGVLAVNAQPAQGDGDSGPARSKVTAHGTPVRLLNADGKASCAELMHEPDSGATLLTGTGDVPVDIASPEIGRIVGPRVHTEQVGDVMLVRVSGPAKLEQLEPPATAAPPKHTAARPAASSIEFAQSLEAVVKTVTHTRWDFRGASVSTAQKRVLDRAAFVGAVKLVENDTSLSADTVDVSFNARNRRADVQPSIDQVIARGHVEMTQGSDKLTGQELHAQLTTDAKGDTIPASVTVIGDVSAVQGNRSIRAKDKLIADFEPYAAEVIPFEFSPSRAGDFGIRRIRAWGDVNVVDAGQGLEVTARDLDASITPAQTIEAAVIKGLPDHPAYVQLADYTVSGAEIRLHAEEDWAEVPGEGRMTFRSFKDLDGRPVDPPLPIVVTWKDRLKYLGRENRAVFYGLVHATSDKGATFDCDELVVEFEEDPADVQPAKPERDWWVLQRAVDALQGDDNRATPRITGPARAKQPVRLVARGRAVALTSDIDPQTEELRGRARLAGPRLIVDLKREISKLIVDGAGSLLIEDFRPSSGVSSDQSQHGGLFGMDEAVGLSKTLIEWKQAMTYDFSFAQARFEGDVDLRHFSGAELARIADLSRWSRDKLPPGRATFLLAEVLTVDFLDRTARSGSGTQSGSMSRLSAQRLEQFIAAGEVTLQDQRPNNHITLTADEIAYEKDRDILAVQRGPDRQAHLISQKPGQLPRDDAFDRAFYQIGAGRLDVARPTLSGQ